MSVDMAKLNTFLGQFVGDLGAAVHAGMQRSATSSAV